MGRNMHRQEGDVGLISNKRCNEIHLPYILEEFAFLEQQSVQSSCLLLGTNQKF